MKVTEALSRQLRDLGVEHVFGLPGETTLAWYRDWHRVPEVRHHLCRDERSSVFMADGYAKATGKVGVCEGPSVGATHMMPGVAEAFHACVPLVVFTSEIPLRYQRCNMLTGCDQTALFGGITKETLTATAPEEVPHLVRLAFRAAVTGRPGPVHLRLPSDVLEGECPDREAWADPRYGRFPGCRSVAAPEDLAAVAKALTDAERPLLFCGQGVVHSGAWEEVRALAERLAAPVGTTINAKGAFPETHPLSLGVLGARGGRGWANRFLEEADLVFFLGNSTDSAGTDGWRLPDPASGKVFLQLDVDGSGLGLNYPVLPLLGDARETLRALLPLLGEGVPPDRSSWLGGIPRGREDQEERVRRAEARGDLHPLHVARILEEVLGDDAFLAVDPGVAAVYSAAFLRLRAAGRRTAYNFAMGALGYALPAALGARWGVPQEAPVVGLVGDGSFGFAAGELETAARWGARVTFLVFDNRTYGWIRGTERVHRGEALEEGYGRFTDFAPVDYVRVAEGFGVAGFRATSPESLREILPRALSLSGPSLVSLPCLPEDRDLPPVPGWCATARDAGMDCLY